MQKNESNLVETIPLNEKLICGLPAETWERIAAAPARLLMLDYDGTLAPFNVDRMAARPLPETIEALKHIIDSKTTHVVIVSGRPAEQVHRLLGRMPLTIVGAHGFERFEHMEGTRQSNLSPAEVEGLKIAMAAAEGAGLRERLEQKPASVALHTRGLDNQEAMELEALAWSLWVSVAEEFGLECKPFSGGVEIRSPNYHKGIAVDTLMAEMPEGVAAVYIGDDETDEDAFRALAGRGAAIRVGRDERESEAPWQLSNPYAVARFLEQWHKVTQSGAGVQVHGTRPARLVVVSNRLPSFSGNASAGTGRGKASGGLATAVGAALTHAGGGIWLGWSGKTRKASGSKKVYRLAADPINVFGLDLSDREIQAYYNGFCNHTLWPLFHSFQGRVELSDYELEVYREVNTYFATSLRELLTEGDSVWIHDYHLIHVGAELRRLGWKGPIGFFLHIPFPSLDLLGILPDYQGFLEALSQYDLIGFHTRSYRDNYVYSSRRVLEADWDGDRLMFGDHCQHVGIYPAGIDPEVFAPPAPEDEPRARKGAVKAGIGERRVILGVDRLDYTKGIPARVMAFERLMKMQPALKGKVSLLQICSPSRTRVKEYIEQKKAMDALVGRVNAELGEHDWEPIRYLYKSYPQSALADFYREADVGLVTPLRDGLNLVAKEFVAAQRPEDPGVLLLSRFAGAGDELTEALMVNPYLPEDCARGIAEALEMPLEERIERHQSMLKKVQYQTATRWSQSFLDDLKRCDPAE